MLIVLLGASRAEPVPFSDAAAWREACHLSGYSCFGISAPLVGRSPSYEWYGRYRMGDTYILVDEKITGNFAYAVTVHEMVHYLQYKHGKWLFTHLNTCQMEHDAFDVSNKVMQRLGDASFIVDWNVKRFSYGCPQ